MTTLTPALLEDVRRTAELCVKCNICTASCPVTPVTELFPGPKYVGPQAQRYRDPGSLSPDRSLDYCSGCGICTLVCPHGVRVMEINTAAKADLRRTQQRENPFDTRLWRNWLLGRNELLGKVGGPVAPVVNAALRLRPLRRLMDKVLHIDQRVPFPVFHFHTFRHWFEKEHQRDAAALLADRPVAYFHGCATNHYEPEVGRAIVAVLEHNGFEVLLPKQVCCGLPMQSNGDFDGARRNALTNLRLLVPYAGQEIPIVVGGTSCGLELKSDYQEILGLHSEEARLVGSHVYDISEFLWLEHQAGRLRTDFVTSTPRYVPYHTSCHQKLHRIGQPALELLNLIPGLTVEEMGADCCGITGTYGYKSEKYDIAHAVGEHLFEHIKATGASLAVCDNETCRWNLADKTGIPVVHTIQLLAEAYGLSCN